MVPWVLSRSLHPSALVCECMCVRVFVCVYVCVCMYVCVLLVQGQQHDPHHFSPSGLVFFSASPAVPWLTPSLPSHACSHSGPLGRCPSPRPAAVKTLGAHLLTFPVPFLRDACSTCQHALHLSARLSSSPQSAGSVRAGACLILLETQGQDQAPDISTWG